ncbi:flagellar basal body-associated protein FliL [Pseudogulbenkiania sp. NH8B]|uniref:flagellar basal body-associated FliL family protein n=1 Tax=Pseudogulbenkiania sp. (strain NH8B) TaxID=748280 RepID=UPI0002279D54|nr:flagellar basal body-associated FliL family protein [Pseudogulbenkiania sp. NH8B]BAK76024.1 flagellar basal body-associated protein FliL [Pseudogulbenkiania sp. NH8B]
MAEEKKAEKKSGGGGNKLMIVVIALLLLVLVAVGGLAAYMFTSLHAPAGDAHAEQAAEKPKKKKDGPPIFEKLDTFVVNLAGNGGNMLQVDMQAELASEEAKKKFTEYMPKIRSALILLLSSKSSDELSTPEGKVKLKAQVKKIINESMDAGEEQPVENILFTAFIIQSQ